MLFVIVKFVSETTLHRGNSFFGLVLEFFADDFGVLLDLLSQSLGLALGRFGELGFFLGEELRFVLDRFFKGFGGLALVVMGSTHGVAVRST